MTGTPIDWPLSHNRTPAEERRPYPGDLSPTRKQSFESVVDELEAWEATEGSVRIETASEHYVDRPNIPHQHDRPDDVGVAAYFRHEGASADTEYAISCDRWESQRENARAIALWARRQRLAERCAVQTADDTVETARLPPADEEVIEAPAPAHGTRQPPHEVLEVAPDASDSVIQAAARSKIKDLHGDTNSGDGDPAKLQHVIAARDQMLKEGHQ